MKALYLHEVKWSFRHVLANVEFFDLGEDHSGSGC